MDKSIKNLNSDYMSAYICLICLLRIGMHQHMRFFIYRFLI